MPSPLLTSLQGADVLPSTYSVTGLITALVVVVVVVVVKSFWHSKLDAIPTVGSTNWLDSWSAGFKFVTSGIDIIQQGYERHNRAPFKIATFHSWTVVLSSQEHIDELRKAPDDTVSFVEAIGDQLQVKYTMAPQIHDNPYHIPIVQSHLTRNLGTLYPEVKNEIITAFDDILNFEGNEWISVSALRTVQEVICRTSNRIFVGLPLCRDPDWVDLNIQFTNFVVKGAITIRLFPDFLKPLAARFLTRVNYGNERGRKLIGPIIEERRMYLNEYENQWADKPNDFLSWLMDEADGPESTVESLTIRMLVLNFTAIHTSSTSFTNALFFLAANPQYIQPLREEVEGIIRKEGWSRAALSKMYKVDSFLRESQRMEGTSAAGLLRKTLKDFTLSDGTTIPKGTTIIAAARSVHYDEEFYLNAHVFDPFRFSDVDQEDKHRYVSPETEYLGFGHGQHACPGRFFAASELKTMLAHIVMMYDVKLEASAIQAKTFYVGTAVLVNPKAKVMFRKRMN